MEIYTIINIYGIFCPWLFFFSAMLYLAYYSPNRVVFTIYGKAQLFFYWGKVLMLVFFVVYGFSLTLTNIEESINVLEIKNIMLNWLKIQPWQSWFVLLFSPMLLFGCLFFFIYAIFCVQLAFRRYALAVYLYYCQWEIFVRFLLKMLEIKYDFMFYLQRRVNLFTENETALKLTKKIWPKFFFLLLSKSVPLVVSYVCIFDYLTQNGVLTKIFVLLPWCYVYYLAKALTLLLAEWVTRENMDFTNSVYKSTEINGEILRWVEVDGKIFHWISIPKSLLNNPSTLS